MNNSLFLLLLFVLTLSGAFGGFFFKKTTASGSFYKMISSPNLYIGSIFYVLGAVFTIYVLKYKPISVVMPLTSITYIWTLIISRFLLHEKITRFKLVGIIFIIIGAINVGVS
jgi:drug/metabolite transporter (DMT)-like permease